MNPGGVIAAIKTAFDSYGNPCHIPKQGGYFTARLKAEGIEVDNLGNQPFLPWAVFEVTIELLQKQGGKAERGNVMQKGIRLGDPGLELTTLEGHIAHTVYKKQLGKSVFRRSTPVVNILVWVGLCDVSKGILGLRKN